MTKHNAAKPVRELKSDKTHNAHWIVRWVRRHKRALAFLGAFIVFMTFVIKDALRDQLKDAMGSMNEAKAFNGVLADTRRIRHQLARIEPPQEINAPVKISDKTDPLIAETIRRVDAAKRECVRQLQNYDAVVGLAEALHGQSEADDTLEQIHKAASALDELVGLELELRTGKPPLSRVQEIRSKISDLISKATLGEAWIEDRTGGLMWLMALRKQGLERKYGQITWTSYWLYALGWSLGLAGRLVGVEVGGGDSD